MPKLLMMKPKRLAKLEKISALDYMNGLKIPEAIRVFVTAAFGEGAFEMSSDKVPASHMIRAFQMSVSKKHPTPRYYEGGVGGFFTTMTETVPEHGGRILWNTRVKSIDIENGKAAGITTESGDTYTAPIVISNAGIRQTVVKLVGEEHFPKDYAERIKGLHSNLADVGYRYFRTALLSEKRLWDYARSAYSALTKYLTVRAARAMESQTLSVKAMVTVQPVIFPFQGYTASATTQRASA
jgi:prolycopene isomerase